MKRRAAIAGIGFGLALAVCILASALSFTSLAGQFDNNVYDFLFRAMPARQLKSPAALVVFDERTFREHGGVRSLRASLAALLEKMAEETPAVVAVDLTLADAGDAEEDARLAGAMGKTPNLVLACEMMPDGSAWQDPVQAFREKAAALGHVSTLAGPYDDVNRRITLERVAGRQRRWAMSLEALKRIEGTGEILSSPDDLVVGQRVIASRWDEGRPLRVRYAEGSIPSIPAGAILEGQEHASLAGKVVFVGITATSAVPDRLFTPLSRGIPVPGVEIHAQAFQTMYAGQFLADAPASAALLVTLLASLILMMLLALVRGWVAWAGAAAALVAVHLLPWALFERGTVLSAFGPVSASWLALLAGGAYRYFFVRRSLAASEAATARYQQAFHFVAHEMRTPLTAIQGSSELMARYNLPDEKRREMGMMINAESKRLARMITTFLDVEKLTAGQMELRRTEFDLQELVDTCYQRALPLAERKQIRITSEVPEGLRCELDRELMEYALYNLMTNAIKYSAPETDVAVGAADSGGLLRVWVKDQGMGMDAEEMKNLFRKFYRTARAEKSGEMGTGIGLSIVQQIVEHHGGRMEVESAPGKGSAFTMALPRTIH
ncbi:MAG: CHASE2 domain-containing protein [Acidobacteria bacterium]|nr:CHASE2 domain-containing protein [Acidobacteriota bacterium]